MDSENGEEFIKEKDSFGDIGMYVNPLKMSLTITKIRYNNLVTKYFRETI